MTSAAVPLISGVWLYFTMKKSNLTYKSCFYCLTRDGRPRKHEGTFICIREEFKDVWFHALEQATHHKIDKPTWENRFHNSNVRVAFEHMTYSSPTDIDFAKPLLIEHVGLPAIADPPKPSRFYLTSEQREIQRQNYDKKRKETQALQNERRLKMAKQEFI